MTVRSLYPADRPNLLLNFARARALDTRVSFTRASTGTYVGADGLIKTAKVNEARLNSNPITGEGTGLIVEPARTNFCSYSNFQQFVTLGSQGWNPPTRATTTQNATTGPDNTNTALLLQEDSSNGTHELTWVGFNPTATLTASVFVKSAGVTTVSLKIFADSANSVFNLTDLTVTSLTGTASIQAFPNGWRKISVTSDAVMPTQNFGSFIFSLGSGSYLGDGTSGAYIWEAQYEAGSLTSHIPTSGSTVTRAADVVTLEDPHFSSLWNPSGGTFLVNYTTPAAGISPILSVDNNTTSNRIELYTSGTSQKFTVTSGGATQCDLTTGTVAANTTYRLSAAYASNDFSSVLNGATPVTANTGTVPTANRLRIGSNQAGNFAVSTFARIAYYPNRYSNTQLRGLATT